LDAKGGVLVRDHVVLVLGVDGAVLWWHPDVVVGQAAVRAAEVLEEVGVSGGVEVDLGVAGVFVLVYCEQVVKSGRVVGGFVSGWRFVFGNGMLLASTVNRIEGIQTYHCDGYYL
jgi:hypothetical protein